jgi:hypothetical protein
VQVLEILSFHSTSNKFWDVGVLWLMVVGHRVLFFTLLKTREGLAR